MLAFRMEEQRMTYRHMDLLAVQLARLVGLVKAVRPVRFSGRRPWALLVEGRGFRRLLEDELLDAPALHRPALGRLPRAKRFRTERDAFDYAETLGLIR